MKPKANPLSCCYVDPTPLRSSSCLYGASFAVWYGVHIPRTNEYDHGNDWAATEGIVEEGGSVYLEPRGIVSVWECDV
jgi:hypothetical protein